MAEIIDFEADMDEMDREALLALREGLEMKLSELDAREPGDMQSEAYEQWGERHEELEDLLDEVMDRLEELE